MGGNLNKLEVNLRKKYISGKRPTELYERKKKNTQNPRYLPTV